VNISVAQLAAETNREHGEAVTGDLAHAAPLGLSAFAFTTALLGCVYAGFIVPSLGTNLSIAVGAALLYGGLVQILAGMWEFRRENVVMATIFSAVLFLSSFRTNVALLGTLTFLFLGFLFLTIGELAGGDFALFAVGGWLAIISALLAWYTALAGLLSAGHSAFKLPVWQLD
jgi:uncharacterized protein